MKKLKLLVYFPIIWFVVHELAITIDGLTSKPRKSEFGVIFGNKVNEDGTLSDRLKARVDEGLKLYQDSLISKIFVSGGLGKEGHYEAEKMMEHLVTEGVPKANIIVDNKGNNTWATVLNFHQQFPDCNSVIVISQYYHISRAKLAFKKFDIDNVYGSSPMYFELRDLYSAFREFFGFYKYLLWY